MVDLEEEIVDKDFRQSYWLALQFWVQSPSTSPWGAYIWRGDLTEGFLCYEFGGPIHGEAYFWNFTVSNKKQNTTKNLPLLGSTIQTNWERLKKIAESQHMD